MHGASGPPRAAGGGRRGAGLPAEAPHAAREVAQGAQHAVSGGPEGGSGSAARSEWGAGGGLRERSDQ